MADLSDGWDEDDNFELDDEVNQSTDGWEADDALFDSDEDNEQKRKPVSGPVDKPHRGESQDGWEDDDDLGLDESIEADDVPGTSVTDKSVRTNNFIPATASMIHPNKQRITEELESYVRSLSNMLSSINAVLEFEYNTPIKAQELLEYYSTRVQLAEYTRTRELPRMEYQVFLPYGHVETDKTQLAQNFLTDDSFIARCANQSLLADLLQVITGPDLVVRPQYLSVCVADRCQFKIHLGDQGDMVDCACHLQLSLPAADGQRFNIAEIKGSVIFAPNQPMVEYRVNSIDLLLMENDYWKLQGTAEFLAMMEGHLDEFPGNQTDPQSTTSDTFRDDFLENSQKFLNQSSQGMKSALQQMESVVGIQKKLEIVKGGYQTISKFIPDTEQMLAAEQEAVAMAQDQFQAPPGTNPTNHSNQATLHDAKQDNENRPKSILGGLVRSGWNRLAKTVPVPDDVDDEAHSSAGPPSQQLQLYRRDEPVGTTPGVPTPIPHDEQFGHPRRNLKNFEQENASENQISQSTFDAPVQKQGLITKSNAEVDTHQNQANLQPPIHNQSGIILESQLSASQSFQSSSSCENSDVASSQSREAQSNPQLNLNRQEHPGQELQNDINLPNPNSEESSQIQQVENIDKCESSFGRCKVDNILHDKKSEKCDNSLHGTREGAVTSSEQETNFAKPPSSHDQNTTKGFGVEKLDVIVNVDYGPEDDIIETRKRWLNPRPHRPYLIR